MKKTMMFTILLISALAANANKLKSDWNIGGDIVSNYVWRGIVYGDGVNVQPYINYSLNKLDIGAWGSYDFNGFGEVDLYVSYTFRFGLSIGVTDYYYKGYDWTDYSKESGSHAVELNASYSVSIVELMANYVVNESNGCAGCIGGDMYFEGKLNFNKFSFHLGVGNGWHTIKANKDFQVTNIGLSSSKDLKISDKFSLPITASAILNPNTEQLYVVLGISI